MSNAHFINIKGVTDIANNSEEFKWVNDVAYPRFSIVRDINSDDVYLSVVNVPAGTALSNTNYWIKLTGGGSSGVTGVKGNDETNYRTGNVNISYSDLGICPVTSGGTGAVNVNPNRVFAGPDNAIGRPWWRMLVADDIPNIEDLNNFSTKVYDATISRAANTVLAAPNGSAGAATFRKLVSNDVSGLTCKQIFSGTAATSVTLTETAANFKLIVVEISVNADNNRFATLITRPSDYTDWMVPILSGSLWYIKGGVVRANGTNCALSSMKNFSVGTGTSLNQGLQNESGCKIYRVWGLL